MLDDMVEVEESKLPSLTDPIMMEYASELAQEFEAFSKPRLLLESEIWPAGDRAFMAIRDEMPFIPSMRLVDNGMLGEPDVRNACKKWRDNVVSSCLPTDGSFMEPASLNEEDDDGSLELVKKFMLKKAKEADLRDTLQIACDQLASRGTTAIGLRWANLFSIKKAPRDMAKGVRQIQEELGLEDDEAILGPNNTIKYAKQIFNGPQTYAVDMYRLWLDPTTDLGGKDREQSWIHVIFKTMHDLKGAKDKKGGHLYDQEVLDDVQDMTYQEYYSQNQYACESSRFMGVDPSLENLGKFVPVYIFYRQVRTFKCDDSVFIERYFYVTRNGRGGQWRVIRVQDAPTQSGVKPFYVFNIDPYLNTPYGVAIAEKAISPLKAKNINEAISLNSRILQLFPPSFFVGGVLKNDRKPKYMPASSQEIVMRPGVGLDWIRPFPQFQAQNIDVGMQVSRYYGEKIQAATGVSTAELMSDPTANMSKERTAAEVKTTSYEGAQSTQVVIDRMNEKLIEPVVNGMYQLCQDNYQEDQKFVSKDDQGKPQMQKMTMEVLGRDREMIIVGRIGLANKAHATQSLTEALEILARPECAQIINNLPLILQDIIFKIISQLGVPIKPEYRATPEEIFAKEPQVIQAAIQQALQNPEMVQQIAQQILSTPEGQQLLQHVHQAGMQAGAQQGQGKPQAKPQQQPMQPQPGAGQ